MTAPLNFTCSLETKQLADHLTKLAKTGDTTTVYSYESLSKAAGANVRVKRHILRSAIHIVARDTGAQFGTVKGEGIKLLTASEIEAYGPQSIQHVRKHTTRTLERLSRVQYDELTAAEQIAHNTNASIIGAMRLMTHRQNIKKVEGAVTHEQAKIDEQSIMRLFGPPTKKDDSP